MSAALVVLGPQRLEPTLAEAIAAHEAELGVPPGEARFAMITAGWEEREDEDSELRAHLAIGGTGSGRMANLQLFQRAEDVFQRDPELLDAMLAHHARIGELQAYYRTRLAHLLEAARTLLARPGESETLEQAREAAIEDVRRLDAQHLDGLRAARDAFLEDWRPLERPSVARHREQIHGDIASAHAVCIAGGHVQILLNRLRLFSIAELLQDQPVFTWSAGAMALSDRVVVFHDSPPQGPGDAEVLEAGVGLFDGLVPLPHARRRLRLEDPTRVALFARRFGPSLCAVLDEGTRVDRQGTGWRTAQGTRVLEPGGAVAEVPS